MLLLLAVPLAVGGAGDAPLDRATLQGLNALGVVVDRLDPELQKEGLSQEGLQARLSERVQRAGVQVESSAPEFLALRLVQVRNRRGPYAVSLTIGLYQPVLLVRDKNVKTATQTWEVETVLMAEPKLLYRASLSSLDELADRFVAAYRSVNPK